MIARTDALARNALHSFAGEQTRAGRDPDLVANATGDWREAHAAGKARSLSKPQPRHRAVPRSPRSAPNDAHPFQAQDAA
ncbi:hypothetical protein [Roseivivax marinus]|uniref:hypothetical protein n=1 Tax=Roseivivax marinus TaxID=1379903 RepID=UPI00274015A7|nr:hypothetical protein [Roseivivax marinus]